MATNNTSYRCARCGASMDTLKEAQIHASGPLHQGSSFSTLFPDAGEAEAVAMKSPKTLEPAKK